MTLNASECTLRLPWDFWRHHTIGLTTIHGNFSTWLLGEEVIVVLQLIAALQRIIPNNFRYLDFRKMPKGMYDVICEPYLLKPLLAIID